MTGTARRQRPLLQGLFVLAVAIIALGYGLGVGTARGHSDAIGTVSCSQLEWIKEKN